MECLYTLGTFGIPRNAVPLTYSGEMKVGNLVKWLHRCQAREKTDFSGFDLRADFPRKYDVLIGRGALVNSNHGNTLIRMLVHNHMEEYTKAPKVGDKGKVTSNLIAMTREKGGWFLKEDKLGQWTPVDDDEAFRKVAKMFRNEKSKAGVVPSSISSSVERNVKRTKVEKRSMFSACCAPSLEQDAVDFGFLHM